MQIAIVLYPGVTALDAVGPYEVLRFLPGAEIRFLAHETGPVLTDSGVLSLHAAHCFADTPSPDILLVPGGAPSGTRRAGADTELLTWLRQAHITSQWTLSVCTGALILGAAGILAGHPATTHWLAQDLLTKFDAVPMADKRIVRSGKIATAAGVSAGIDLGLTILAEIAGPDQAKIAQLAIEYDPEPPVDAGHPRKASDDIVAKTRQLMTAKIEK